MAALHLGAVGREAPHPVVDEAVRPEVPERRPVLRDRVAVEQAAERQRPDGARRGDHEEDRQPV